MTGRSLHDALLRVLTSAERRARLAGSEGDGASEEERTLRRADPDRLRRLARFLGRHFYRERIVRLFAASRRLAWERGRDPLTLVETLAFDALLEAAEVGSGATAEGMAVLIERWLLEALDAHPYARDLVRYEGALFRAEAGPRRWGLPRDAGGVPARAASVRIITLDWDITALATAARRGDAVLPEVPRTPTRLLVALSPDGRVTTARCAEPLERLLEALDGTCGTAAVAARVGVDEAEVARVLRQLGEIGAVEWLTRVP